MDYFLLVEDFAVSFFLGAGFAASSCFGSTAAAATARGARERTTPRRLFMTGCSAHESLVFLIMTKVTQFNVSKDTNFFG